MAPQVQKTAAELAGAGFTAPRTMECLLREYEVGARPAARGTQGTGPACVAHGDVQNQVLCCSDRSGFAVSGCRRLALPGLCRKC